MGTPDLERDVIVHHVLGAIGEADRWVVLVGPAKRAEMDNAQGAHLYARLLANLQQRPVWVCHDTEGPFERFDSSALRGCTCC